MKIEGLERMIVLEGYGLVIVDGKLIQLELDACRRLSEMKHLLENSNKPHIRIQPEMMESIMERVVPGLMKLGSVHVAQTVSDRIVKTPLKAKLYLDRCVAGFWPDSNFNTEKSPLIRWRDIAQHTAAQSSFATESRSGFLSLWRTPPLPKRMAVFMNDEDAEYDFLYHTIPELEKRWWFMQRQP